jgi:hypothetical protein
MDYKQSLIATMAKVTEEKAKSETELKRLEEEFANVKLNPYGITSIDFSKRQDISQDNLKMEGVLMGLQLALDSWEEAQLGVAAE